MTKNLLRFFSGIIIFIYLVVLCVPALASAGTEYKQTTNLFHWWKDAPFWGDLIGYTTGFVCTESEDGYHHSSTFDHKSWLSEGDRYRCTCDYCGREFTAYESDLKKIYTKQVSELPATGINSAGRLIWHTYDSFDGTGEGYFYYVPYYSSIRGDKFTSLPYYADTSYYTLVDSASLSLISSSKSLHLSVVPANGYFAFGYKINVQAPVSGSYRRIESVSATYRVVTNTGDVISDSLLFSAASSFSHYSAGDNVSLSLSKCISSVVSGSADSYFPYYEVIPDTVIDTSAGGQYSITTRPTAITGGNYGIVGDNGTINTVTNNKPIINEITNIFYNPATGQEYPIGDWSYNYENRTYTITLDTGDTVNVEYGDENINITETTIIEGDTIVNNYTVYYIVEGTGGGDTPTPAPTPCVHSWQESSRTDPTCTFPGRAVYTCSKCGETKTETLSATGHTWQVERTVQTVYDENGDIIQQGYTIYQCASCGEQYKDMDSTGPPPPGGDVDDGGLTDWLNSIIKFLSDNLSGAVELILSFFTEIPKLFGGFLNFLSAMFPFLPDEIMLLLTFGIAALVFVGIIKAIRR